MAYENVERHAYATERWAHAAVKVVISADDTRTVYGWARLAGISRRSLTTWCAAAQIPLRPSLDFSRLLRAVLLTNGTLDQLYEVLDIIEPRTMHRLIARSGFQQRECITAEDFLARQTLVRNPHAVRTVALLLRQAGILRASQPVPVCPPHFPPGLPPGRA